MLVHDLLDASAVANPAGAAIVEAGRAFTYRELAQASGRVAGWLARHGVRRGDRAVMLFKNGFDYAAVYYGILKAGAIAVPVDPAIGGGLGHVLEDAAPRALLHDRAGGRAVRALKTWPGSTAVLVHDGAGAAAPAANEDLQAILDMRTLEAPPVRSIDLDPATIIYTSGTTARPRGAVLSHLNLVSNTRSIVEYMELTSRDRMLVVLPFHYVFGKSLLNTHVAVGGTLIIENRFLYPAAVLETLREAGATGFAGVPSTFAILLRRTAFRNMTFPRLRYVAQAGGALPPALIRELMAALPTQKIYIMYGATEAAARLAYLPPEDLLQKLGSIGKPIPNVELYPVRPDGAPCAPGEVGELVARGSNIMMGYWNDPEETARVLRDGRLHTGDLARADEDGDLYIVGRARHMIKVGGGRVSPQEVEAVLAEVPGVLECAVVGVPDEILGEAIKAYVVPVPGQAPATGELAAHARRRLPPFKVPRHLEIVAALPRNAAGKIRRNELKDSQSVLQGRAAS